MTNLIATDTTLPVHLLGHMLDGYDCPAILVSANYEVLAANDLYRNAFGALDTSTTPHCFQVSHGYTVPCDQAGEDCPLAAATLSGKKERVLHIHQTVRGREHVDVEMLPIYDAQDSLVFFVELLKPVPLASGAVANRELVGFSPVFNRMLEKIAKVGAHEASVLLMGESGTGKELAARAVHLASRRAARPMVTLECAGLTDSLFESELFGHIKGAFTGAHSTTAGLVKMADGGTLFLDEIGDVPLSMQVKLLRLLESRTFRPVGSTTVHTSDFRLICASHKDIAGMVAAGTFRQDLYYRINVFPLHVPPLAARLDDLPMLATSLLRQISPDAEYHLTPAALTTLRQQAYPGNIRELRNLLTRAVVLSDSPVLDQHTIIESLNYGAYPAPLPASPTTPALASNLRADETTAEPIWTSLKVVEKQYLDALMLHLNQDKVAVARTAGISLRTLYRKIGT
ncbi:MAG: sigma-54 dependent transcriptional regulator [Pseudomonadales bacterium]|nr:sigma-54 dependent transcriptional regulator [Pseudomonadales bacterium]MDP4876569.1 sigma-54 dependent transcriptional regulator [Pseudomonadales bacterium]